MNTSEKRDKSLTGLSDIIIEARLSIDSVLHDIERAVKRFNEAKPHEYYQRFSLRVFSSRRTGGKSLWISKFSIPRTGRTSKNDEYIVIAIYLSTETPVEKYHFEERFSYIYRRIEEFAERDSYTDYHYFIFFCGYGFRAGVEDAIERVRSKLFRDSPEAVIRYVDLRNGESIRSKLYMALKEYFGARVYGILRGDYERSENRVFGPVKAFIDYQLMILANLKRDGLLITRLEDIARKGEYDVNEYRNIIESLIGPPKNIGEGIKSIEAKPIGDRSIDTEDRDTGKTSSRSIDTGYRDRDIGDRDSIDRRRIAIKLYGLAPKT